MKKREPASIALLNTYANEANFNQNAPTRIGATHLYPRTVGALLQKVLDNVKGAVGTKEIAEAIGPHITSVFLRIAIDKYEPELTLRECALEASVWSAGAVCDTIRQIRDQKVSEGAALAPAFTVSHDDGVALGKTLRLDEIVLGLFLIRRKRAPESRLYLQATDALIQMRDAAKVLNFPLAKQSAVKEVIKSTLMRLPEKGWAWKLTYPTAKSNGRTPRFE